MKCCATLGHYLVHSEYTGTEHNIVTVLSDKTSVKEPYAVWGARGV